MQQFPSIGENILQELFISATLTKLPEEGSWKVYDKDCLGNTYCGNWCNPDDFPRKPGCTVRHKNFLHINYSKHTMCHQIHEYNLVFRILVFP